MWCVGVPMSLTAGAYFSCSKDIDLEDNNDAGRKNKNLAREVYMEEKKEEEKKKLGRCLSEVSLGDEEEEEGEADKVLDLGPQVTLKAQLEKAKGLRENGRTLRNASLASLLKEAIHVISCGYEDMTGWVKEVKIRILDRTRLVEA